MGEQEEWVQPVGLNGLRPGEPTDSIFQVLDERRWLIAEERASELIACIKPTKMSEQHRLAVADYVRTLVMKCVPAQVFTFGSVPLKTYLPDGDIDLTTFSWTVDSNDSWPNEVCIMLEREEKNENAEFRVQEVQFIKAEVKIVKCLVENIVVDISFNQIGGICTLCFLEEVDHIVSNNHLFKRSIILIKAWCYYESRILGAHHGLISTYALETLVLYIFHVFNDSFKGPLEVLYRFLEFFSKFDWENFCVSLWGPVPLGSLPEITAEPPRKDSRQLLLENVFLEKCTHVYGYNSQQEQNGTHFPKRSFNVVDPLRVNNNLGRSVSRGNFFRIRSAFAFGAVKLARLLDCPEENLHVEVNQFFSNTWQRHDNRIRPDAPCKLPKCLRPSTPDSSKFTVEERQESCTAEAKNASTGHHDNAWEGLASKISSGTSSQITQNHSSAVTADVDRESASVLRPADSKNSDFGSTGCNSINRNVTLSEAQEYLNTTLTSDRRTSVCSSSDYAADSEVSSSSYQNSYLDGHTFKHASREQFAEDEHDRKKMMTASMFHGFNGHFHLPLNMPSGHLPLTIPPSILASLSSNQKNMEGVFQGNFPLVENPWAMNMQFTAVPPAMAHYFQEAEASEMNGVMNPTDLAALDVENKLWHNHDRNSFEVFDLEKGTSDVHFDDRPPSVPGHQLQGDDESYRNISFDHQYLNNVENEAEEALNSMTLPSDKVYSSLRNRTPGSSWDGKSGKSSNVTQERQIRKTAPSDMESADHERVKIVSERSSTQPDDDECGKDGKITVHECSINRNELQNMHTPIGQNHQLPSIELPSKTGMETGIDCDSEENAADNPGVPPFRFIPAGPPVPFLTMLTLYNVPNGTGTGTGSNTRIVEYEEPGSGEHRRWDMFDSNLLAHLQILMYARSCQASQNNQRLGYASQFTHPSPYCIPSGGPVRPLPPNMNRYTPFTSGDGRYIPMFPPITSMPIQPPDYQPCVEEMPRYRGTGTYLPNPKLNVRDGKVSGNRRVNYSYDRNDQRSDKGGNWNHNKPRAAGRNHSQNQNDKGGPRFPRWTTGESGSEKSWGGSYRRPDSEFTCQSQVLEFGTLGPVELPGTKDYSLVKDANRPTRVSEDLHFFEDN